MVGRSGLVRSILERTSIVDSGVGYYRIPRPSLRKNGWKARVVVRSSPLRIEGRISWPVPSRVAWTLRPLES